MENPYYVYILRCGDGTLYTGITNNLRRRFQVHQSGKGAKYTRGRGPLWLVYTQKFASKREALREEMRIKSLTRLEKEELIEKENN